MRPSSRITISTEPLSTATLTSTSPAPWTSALSSRISTLWVSALGVTSASADLGSAERQLAPGTVELRGDGMNVSINEGDDIDTGLRGHPTGAGQREQLVDAVVETGNLGEGFCRLPPSSGIRTVADQLQADGDGGERRSQLMTGVGAELTLGRHQLGNALTAVFERLGDRVDLHQTAAGRRRRRHRCRSARRPGPDDPADD